ncbi:glycerol dehydratase reactivase beta/small subunit family protein [Anaerosalibacter massiliensis]|uniref:Glycerol dehydratase reactivase beta/small subunit family protein n=1 Tax=Anaerosalibacter massiliensis TaxID=1347392 RepID=A0A9X2MI27_9FIRM|nr:glycerol dehydratase reactivase beta/small subunit family protein [Anaerosalibacter massiliensis]MCR2044079.1 glycerol dehydratase reactivase beta/small subunit family protein [Anaerosalibacter massiliensis]
MNNVDRPTINIYYSSQIKDKSSYNQLLWGIEEEGLPYNIESKPLENSIELGYSAAEDSKLNVGIGIGKDGNIIVHYQKLNKEEPLFSLNIKDEHHNLRKLGANAARLIKGIAFKSFSDDAEIDEKENGNKDDSDNYVDIEMIVKKVMESL